MNKEYGNIDSKYRFVIVASKRAKDLLKGAKARIQDKSKNAIRIAQKEVRLGLVDFEILTPKREEIQEEESVFLGEGVAEGFGDEEEAAADLEQAEMSEAEVEEDVDHVSEVELEEEFEPLEGLEEEEDEETEESS